jgi:hypothetical protein
MHELLGGMPKYPEKIPVHPEIVKFTRSYIKALTPSG